MIQLVVLGVGVENGSVYVFALEPDKVDVCMDFETD